MLWLLPLLSLIFLTSKPSKMNKELSRTAYNELWLGGGHEFEQTLGLGDGQSLGSPRFGQKGVTEQPKCVLSTWEVSKVW